ncbi:MAG: hypothetical protein HY209_00905 [Candidatus Omnitrophica bacterium]|nr:hypothetical protein [Candidatus Omnitrophota bacterium]
MRFIIVAILALLIAQSVLAQNTQISENTENRVVQAAPEPTITLDAKVVQIVLNDEHRQGVDWEAIVSDFHSLQLKKEDNPIWADKKYKISVGEVSDEDYAVLLDALDTVGRVSHTDFPSLVFKKNESGTMDVSPDPKVLPAIHMDCMWFNSPAGEAKLKIETAISMMLKDSGKPGSLATLKAQTDVDLKDNTTVVIGGLMREEEITKVHKFPLLGDLPLLGLVFRKQGKLMHKTETIVFLSMHPGAAPTPAEEQK